MPTAWGVVRDDVEVIARGAHVANDVALAKAVSGRFRGVDRLASSAGSLPPPRVLPYRSQAPCKAITTTHGPDTRRHGGKRTTGSRATAPRGCKKEPRYCVLIGDGSHALGEGLRRPLCTWLPLSHTPPSSRRTCASGQESPTLKFSGAVPTV